MFFQGLFLETLFDMENISSATSLCKLLTVRFAIRFILTKKKSSPASYFGTLASAANSTVYNFH